MIVFGRQGPPPLTEVPATLNKVVGGGAPPLPMPPPPGTMWCPPAPSYQKLPSEQIKLACRRSCHFSFRAAADKRVEALQQRAHLTGWVRDQALQESFKKLT